ncbi:hypothetical protein MCHI_002116 [Candidatus Magnetoovum chiemensis]|nr:hypothetical protein MCHI_002116 [Candidatus Magnetoovum chiemensis]
MVYIVFRVFKSKVCAFCLSSIASNSFLSYSKKIYKIMPFIMAGSGVILIIFGALLLSGKLQFLNYFIPSFSIEL